MNEIVQHFLPVLVQAPMVAILLFQLNTLWLDWKAERDQARAERLAMLDSLNDIYSQLFRLSAVIYGDDTAPGSDDIRKRLGKTHTTE